MKYLVVCSASNTDEYLVVCIASNTDEVPSCVCSASNHWWST